VSVALATLALVWPRGAGALDGGRELQKGPYLQHLASTSVDVKAELSQAAAVTVTVTAEAAARPDAGASTVVSPPALFHTVHVAGLTPSTRYRYSLRTAHGASHDGSFTTAPPETSQPSHEPFSFVVYGDNRSDDAAHARVVHAIAKETYDLLVNTGDFVIEGSDEGAWQSFFDVEQPLLEGHCLFACVGNHEIHNDRAATHFERYLGPVEPTAAAPKPPIYGTFRWGRARFFLLNAFDDWQAGSERAWLDGALARADHEEGVDLRVAVIHHGPYSSGPHGNNQALLEAHIDDVLVAHHVDLVLAGHDHIYERGESHGLKYIVTGGGGAPIYREVKPLPSTRKVEATLNYVLATVTDGAVQIVAKRPDGSTIEQCSFARGGSWLCDAAPKVAPVPAAPSSAPPPTTGGGCDVSPSRARGSALPFSLAAIVAAALRLSRASRARSRPRAPRRPAG
jgi:hypothetical protein